MGYRKFTEAREAKRVEDAPVVRHSKPANEIQRRLAKGESPIALINEFGWLAVDKATR